MTLQLSKYHEELNDKKENCPDPERPFEKKNPQQVYTDNVSSYNVENPDHSVERRDLLFVCMHETFRKNRNYAAKEEEEQMASYT